MYILKVLKTLMYGVLSVIFAYFALNLFLNVGDGVYEKYKIHQGLPAEEKDINAIINYKFQLEDVTTYNSNFSIVYLVVISLIVLSWVFYLVKDIRLTMYHSRLKRNRFEERKLQEELEHTRRMHEMSTESQELQDEYDNVVIKGQLEYSGDDGNTLFAETDRINRRIKYEQTQEDVADKQVIKVMKKVDSDKQKSSSTKPKLSKIEQSMQKLNKLGNDTTNVQAPKSTKRVVKRKDTPKPPGIGSDRNEDDGNDFNVIGRG